MVGKEIRKKNIIFRKQSKLDIRFPTRFKPDTRFLLPRLTGSHTGHNFKYPKKRVPGFLDPGRSGTRIFGSGSIRYPVLNTPNFSYCFILAYTHPSNFFFFEFLRNCIPSSSSSNFFKLLNFYKLETQKLLQNRNLVLLYLLSSSFALFFLYKL